MSDHMVIGLGQIGSPLRDMLGAHGRDLDAPAHSWPPGHSDLNPAMMHVCFPFSDSFQDDVIGYVDKYHPAFCVIHSTVLPGTTASIAGRPGCHMLYSPVRGRHGKMAEDLAYFTKYVAGFNVEAAQVAAGALAAAGLRAQIVPSVKALELSKLLQTSFTGLLVAWAQEVQRFCDELGVDYDDACELFREMPNLPHVLHQPGFIGGHCIMDNLSMLASLRGLPLLNAVSLSNHQWDMEHDRESERVWPKPWRQYV